MDILSVSVITPLYNSGFHLPGVIESLQSQTYDDWQLIIVDDCSTDASVEVAEKFAENDTRIRLIRLDRNSGPAVARNTGIEAATGRYIAFLDSDDLWLPDKLQKQIAFMQSGGYAFSHTYYEKITEAGERTGRYVRPKSRISYNDLLKSNRIGCLTAMYDTHKLGKVYMPLLRKRQDYGLWLQILKQTPYAYCLPECTALYRIRGNSISRNKFELLKYNWSLFRDIEKMSFLRSTYYLFHNVLAKIF